MIWKQLGSNNFALTAKKVVIGSKYLPAKQRAHATYTTAAFSFIRIF
jgi:hypothetical protein